MAGYCRTVEEKHRVLERQRKRDCEYILKQEHEIERIQAMASGKIKGQEEQIRLLKEMLAQNMQARVKTEAVVKRLREDERTKDIVNLVLNEDSDKKTMEQEYMVHRQKSPSKTARPSY